MWLIAGKEPRLDLLFTYALDNPPLIGRCSEMTDKISCSSAIQRMLLERTTQRKADVDSSGQASTWAPVYRVMRSSVKTHHVLKGTPFADLR